MRSTKEFLNHQKHAAGRYLSIASGASLAGGVILIGQAWCLARAVDGIIFKEQDLKTIFPWLGGVLVCAILRAVLGFMSERWAFRGAAKIRTSLRESIMTQLIAQGPVGSARHQPGDLANLWVEGVDALQAYYARYLPAMGLIVFLPLAILVFTYPVDWVSGLIMTVTAPLIPFFMIMIGKGTEKLNRKQWKRLSYMSGYFLDKLQGLTTLKLFNASRREIAMIETISEDYRLETMAVLRVAFLSSLMLEFLATISIALVAVLIGFRLLWGEIDFLRGFFVLLLAPEFYLPLRRMGVLYHAKMEAMAAAERIAALLVKTGPPPAGTGQAVPDGPLTITFENVTFSYDNLTPVLQGVGFTVRPGHKMALTGPSGSGKSTIMSLLLGFIKPDQGRITVNGMDLNEIDPVAWRQALSWVPQKPHLFNVSLLDNLRLGSEAVPFEEVQRTAMAFYVDEIAATLPGGYGGMVGENGLRLSGGQIQRISLMRAFLRQPRLFLLDEPTASLDRVTETSIQTAIDGFGKDCSVLTIAHRLHTVQAMDEIIVLEQGRVAAIGSHDELCRLHPPYRKAASC